MKHNNSKDGASTSGNDISVWNPSSSSSMLSAGPTHAEKLLPFKRNSGGGNNTSGGVAVNDHPNNNINRQSSFKRYLNEQQAADSSSLLADGLDISNFPTSQASGKQPLL